MYYTKCIINKRINAKYRIFNEKQTPFQSLWSTNCEAFQTESRLFQRVKFKVLLQENHTYFLYLINNIGKKEWNRDVSLQNGGQHESEFA